VSHVAFAGPDVDLRVKLGSAAGVDNIEIADFAGADTSQEDSSNFQIEVAFSPRQDSAVNFVGTVGIFGRDHKGHVDDLFLPTDVEYKAAGLSGSAGVSIKTNENLHFEGRLELALGSGELTFSKPGLQLGLELGAQTFVGNFQIWDDVAGAWTDGKVKGSGGMANLVIGYRF
jgi:hypothetical protein